MQITSSKYELNLSSVLEGGKDPLGDQSFQVLVDSFHPNDKTNLGPGQPAAFNFYNAVPDFFAGKNKARLNEFVQYLTNIRAYNFDNVSTAFPGCAEKPSSAVSVYTYSKPHQVYQKDLLTWTQSKLGFNNFCHPERDQAIPMRILKSVQSLTGLPAPTPLCSPLKGRLFIKMRIML